MTADASTQRSSQGHEDDAQLLRRITRGDKLACSQLYDRFSRRLYSLALRILNDRTAAEHVVHEVFLSLPDKTKSSSFNRCSVLAWTIALTRRHAIDRLRERRPGGALSVQADANDLLTHRSMSSPASAGDPVLKERMESIDETAPDFSALLPEELALLELAFFSGLTPPEIAAQLSEPLSTIRARVRLGLLKLRHVHLRRHD